MNTGVALVRLLVAIALSCAVSARAAEPSPGGARPFKQLRVDGAVISFPTPLSSAGSVMPAWLHLHGAPTVVEANFAAIGAPGVLINVTLPGLSKAYADHFADQAVLPALLREVEAALRREIGGSIRIGRLVVSSFSAGFGGVRQLLRQSHALARIDAVVMADSIYCGYAGDATLRHVDDELMAGFLQFAELARAGAKRFVISHSEQVPEGYASTTETANYLIARLGGERESASAGEWPAGLRLTSRAVIGNFEVLGFAGAAPEDHMRHLRGISAFLARALEQR